jgi:hypothetical protein
MNSVLPNEFNKTTLDDEVKRWADPDLRLRITTLGGFPVRAWRNGRRDRLKICFRKKCRFESGRPYHLSRPFQIETFCGGMAGFFSPGSQGIASNARRLIRPFLRLTVRWYSPIWHLLIGIRAIDRIEATAILECVAKTAIFPLFLNTISRVEPVAALETMTGDIAGSPQRPDPCVGAESLKISLFHLLRQWKHYTT